MLRLEEVIQLKDGEDIRMVTKRHAMTAVPKLVLACFLIVIPFFFLFPLIHSGPSGSIVFAVLVLVGAIVAWRTVVLWDGDAFVVTTKRMVKVTQTGFFSRTIQEIANEGILDLSWSKKGFLGHFCNFGTITLQAKEKFEIVAIPRPKELFALIQDMVEMAKKQVGKTHDIHETRVDRITKIVEQMSDGDLANLERSISAEDRQKMIQEVFQPSEEHSRVQRSSKPKEESFSDSPEPFSAFTKHEVSDTSLDQKERSSVYSHVSNGISVKNVTEKELKPLDE